MLLERAGWLLGTATTSTTSTSVWPHQLVLVQSCHVGYCWQNEGWPGDRRRGEDWKTPVSLCISTASHPARAGHQTCQGLTWQLRPLHPTLALLTWRTQQSPRWRNMSHRWVWSCPSLVLSALLHRCRCALGHNKSHDQLVWKPTTKFLRKNVKGQKRNCGFQSS